MSVDLIFNSFLSKKHSTKPAVLKSIDNDPLILLPTTLTVHIFLWPNEVPLTTPKTISGPVYYQWDSSCL